ncbi:DUF5712 family protein [Hymenobacter rubripertinctus]|uniref:DUF5712 family protein n=1 Tax=Hymenobacter rubripertinctus TaxID=2029981 RepID=UPI0016021B82|nr:DUF5712 family protein [Hymenobacter rubripertinctus]
MLYAKVINPAIHGRKVYANTGSARRTTNYLEQEAKQAGREGAEFFGTEKAGVLSADQVVEMLDNNHKGLRQGAAKFYSLVLSPEPSQTAYLGNDARHLAAFTRAAMELYAKNFSLEGNRKLGESELVWAATIHRERTYRGTDDGPQGQEKGPLQTHIHVLVSARDRAQKITLNPLGTANRFDRVDFHATVGIEIEERIGKLRFETGPLGDMRRRKLIWERAEYIHRRAKENSKRELTPEKIGQKETRLEAQLIRINSKLITGQKLDPDRVKEAARERNFDDVFYKTLGKIERRAEAGRITIDPIEHLTTGWVQQGVAFKKWQPQQAPPPMSRELHDILTRQPKPGVGSAVAAIERRIQELASATQPLNASQQREKEQIERVCQAVIADNHHTGSYHAIFVSETSKQGIEVREHSAGSFMLAVKGSQQEFSPRDLRVGEQSLSTFYNKQLDANIAFLKAYEQEHNREKAR